MLHGAFIDLTTTFHKSFFDCRIMKKNTIPPTRCGMTRAEIIKRNQEALRQHKQFLKELNKKKYNWNNPQRKE